MDGRGHDAEFGTNPVGERSAGSGACQNLDEDGSVQPPSQPAAPWRGRRADFSLGGEEPEFHRWFYPVGGFRHVWVGLFSACKTKRVGENGLAEGSFVRRRRLPSTFMGVEMSVTQR
jgi:hypothetical protein